MRLAKTNRSSSLIRPPVIVAGAWCSPVFTFLYGVFLAETLWETGFFLSFRNPEGE